MSYTIKHYNGTLLATVQDGTVDTSTDLTLIGKNYAGYGQAQNDNFVWLLENFANTSAPPNPLAGQIWFNTSSNKLQFYDANGNWRTTGGAEIGTSAPTGLTQGDFWFNTASNQLYAYTGSTFTLIGPQEVTGQGTTQMQSVSLLDTSNVAHAVIEGIADGEVIFIMSSDAFQLSSSNPITGFDWVQQGVTLCYTEYASNGVTSGTQRFWGTATNAEKLGGLAASSYVQAGNASFSTLVNFSDTGFTVGNPVAKLSVFNASQTTPTIQNTYGSNIQFETTVGGATVTPLIINGLNLTPGTSGVSSLGSPSLQWANVYAGYVFSTALQSDALNVGGNYVTASIASVANTVVARDSNQNIFANLFQGTATAAQYADLAEKYLPDAEYEPGTVMSVGGNKEVCACSATDIAIGVVSTNPAYMMNSELVGGIYIALKGRVPVKIYGGCSKGDRIVPYGAGWGCSYNNAPGDGNPIFAVALEDCNTIEVTLVECVIL
jgi:hypothetical protein